MHHQIANFQSVTIKHRWIEYGRKEEKIKKTTKETNRDEEKGEQEEDNIGDTIETLRKKKSSFHNQKKHSKESKLPLTKTNAYKKKTILKRKNVRKLSKLASNKHTKQVFKKKMIK